MPNDAVSSNGTPEGLRSAMPRTTTADAATSTAGTVALSLLPVVGSAVATTFQSVLQAVSQREMERWLNRLAEVVDSICQILGVPVAEVVGDGQFFESAVRATRAAQETTDPRKLEILKNAVSNSGSWTSLEPLLERTLMRLVVQLEPEQVELLRVVRDPHTYLTLHPELPDDYSLMDVYTSVMHASGDELGDVIGRQINDLYMSGLLAAGFGPGFAPLRDDATDFALTALGDALLRYGSPPGVD